MRAAPITVNGPWRIGPSGSFASVKRWSCCGAGSRTRARRAAALRSSRWSSCRGTLQAGINAARPLLHRLVSADDNQAVRRLAVVCLRNGSPSRDTLVLLNGLADDDEADRELREVSRKVAAALKKKSDTRQ